MYPSLNSHQSMQLRRHLAELEAARKSYPDLPAISELVYLPCAVPSLIGVLNVTGQLTKLLYPTPLPVNKDPMFQHAEPLCRKMEAYFAALDHGRDGFRYDWQWSGELMFAPRYMPAGGVRSRKNTEDTYAASQIETVRDDNPSKSKQHAHVVLGSPNPWMNITDEQAEKIAAYLADDADSVPQS